MAKRQQKKRDKISSEKIKQSDSALMLDNVLALGGTKADFELLQGVEEGENEIDYAEDMDADPVKKDELRELIKELGFEKVMEKHDESTKKIKLLSMPLSEEEKQLKQKEIDHSSSKKKKKNKYKVQDEEISSTTLETIPSSSSMNHYIEDYFPRKYLLIKPGGKWFDIQWSDDPAEFEKASHDCVVQLKTYAERLLNDEVALSKKQYDSSSRSDVKWVKTVMASGTLADKTAALTLLIQDSPIHNLQSLDTLIGMVKKKGRREALSALDTLKELWMSELLPDKQKLRKFDEHPLGQVKDLSGGNKETIDKRLLVWYYEDQLKEKYESFIKALSTMSHDQISAPKKKVLTTVFELLASKPEQERMLLELIINKLGDPDHKVASHAAHLLTKLVGKHSNMKMVVCTEVERLLYRKNISEKAQYYGVCFLNQILLNHSQRKLAAKLISIYFSFFKIFAQKKHQVETKMLSALLTGVNRAFPYAKVDLKSLDEQLAALYKTVHMAHFNTGVQALMLLFHVVDASDAVMCDRYYQALYKKMLDTKLQSSSRQAMFLNLIFKSLKKDDSERRIKAFVKRLLQICNNMTPTFVCGALVLLSEILNLKPEVLKVTKISTAIEEESDDEEEHFTDVKEEGSDAERSDMLSLSSDKGHEVELKVVLSDKGHSTVPSWVHRCNTGKKVEDRNEYDPMYRNPMYCHADRECVWELRRLSEHFHPTVALFAKQILKGEKIQYTSDPLQDFTLIRFLDRFVYRNPKKNMKNVVSSLDPRSKSFKLKGTKAIAVNDKKYAQLEESAVPVDEKFFYKYFKQQAAKKKQKFPDDYDSDADSVGDDEFDDYLDQYESQLEGKEPDFDFDFASELGKQRRDKRGDILVEDSDDEDLVLSDEEVDFDDDFKMDLGDIGEVESDDDDEEGFEGTEMEGTNVGFDEEDIAFSDEDMEEMDFSDTKKKKKDSNKKPKKDKTFKSSGLFAAAEEFAHLMDENAGSKFDLIGTDALSNKDNAHVKQLRWESDRDKWVRGEDWKSKKKLHKKAMAKKRPVKQKGATKSRKKLKTK